MSLTVKLVCALKFSSFRPPTLQLSYITPPTLESVDKIKTKDFLLLERSSDREAQDSASEIRQIALISSISGMLV
ncbi:hypothetical protein FKW77_006249 [Venturia effusa]|uniref:Uncharacterized protein n=1 Tax=Venturia effusa TaxID=50376 RepID=A0A517LKD2_9PEZI|nr:hypothetical protein FKW77_006249 [Venturia effusa]